MYDLTHGCIQEASNRTASIQSASQLSGDIVRKHNIGQEKARELPFGHSHARQTDGSKTTTPKIANMP